MDDAEQAYHDLVTAQGALNSADDRRREDLTNVQYLTDCAEARRVLRDARAAYQQFVSMSEGNDPANDENEIFKGIPAVHSWYTFEDLVSPGDRVWIVIENTGLLLGVISTVSSGYFCMRVDEASREIVNGYQHTVISTWKTRVTNIHVWGFMIKEEVK